MKILIINQPTNNRGDEAAHKSLMRMLNSKFPKDSIEVLFFNEPKATINEFVVENKNNTYTNIPSFKGAKTLLKYAMKYSFIPILELFYPAYKKVESKYKDVDLVICAPGGICMGAYQNWYHILLLSIAKKFDKKLVYYSRSFGPFSEENYSQKKFKKISYDLLQKFDFFSLRDTVSFKLADSIGLNYVKSIDTAFLDTPSPLIPNIVKEMIGDNYIVYVPNQLSWHPMFQNVESGTIDDFYNKIINVVLEKLPETKVIMLPQLFNMKNGGDEKYFRDTFRDKNSNIVVIDDTLSSDIQQKIISNAKLMIGARYHSIVFAINNNTPFVALSYEHKISGLLDNLSLSEQCIDLTFLNNENIDEGIESSLSLIKNTIDDFIIGSNTFISNTNETREIAQNCANELESFVGNLK